MNPLTVKADGKFQIKGRGTVFTANKNDNPDINLPTLLGQTITVIEVMNPQPPLQVEGQLFTVTAVEMFTNGFNEPGNNVGLVVRPAKPAVMS